MKTLEELNEKSWYRLLKVFYIVMWLPYPLMLYLLATISEGPVKACIILTGLYILFVGGIRRAFYYVLIGAMFPNKRGSAQGCVISEEQATTSPIRKPRHIAKLQAILKLKVVGHRDEGEAERFLRIRRRRTWATALIGCLIIIGSYIGIYEYFTGFSWKEYSFRNDELIVSLPFELKKDPAPSSQDDFVSIKESYTYGNETLNVTVSYTELKPEYEYNIRKMVSNSLAEMREAKESEIVNQNSEDFLVNGYPAARVNIDFVKGGLKLTTQYVYVIVAKNKCWFLCNTYQRQKNRSHERSI